MTAEEYRWHQWRSLSEAQFQRNVVNLAHELGWRVYHHDTKAPGREANTGRRVRAMIGRGFPDLVMVREGRIIFAELKTERGKLSAYQQVWQAELSASEGVEHYVWRPHDETDIAAILQGDKKGTKNA